MLKTRVTAGLAALAAAASVAIAVAPAASAAEYPSGPIEMNDIKYGASYMTGTVTFYNRSVGITGPAHFVGCRTIYAFAYDVQPGGARKQLDAGSTSPQCDRDHFVNIPLAADVSGGADLVRLEMRDGNGKALGPYHEYVLVR
jgi:hypothetical protein